MTGIVPYTDSQDIPQSVPWETDVTCTDEDWDLLKPAVSWQVGPPVDGEYGENLTVIFDHDPSIFRLAFASIGGDNFNPMYLDYSKPTFLHLNFSGVWDPLLVVFEEDGTNTEWVSELSIPIIGVYEPRNVVSRPSHLSSHKADQAIGLLKYYARDKTPCESFTSDIAIWFEP